MKNLLVDSNGYSLRTVGVEDATTLAELLNMIIDEGDKTAIETRFDADTFQEWFITGTHCRSCVVVEKQGVGPVGFQATERFLELPAGWADVATFLSEDFRGLGLGKFLFARTLRLAPLSGLQVLRAIIRAKNTAAIAYYRSCGFKSFTENDALNDAGYGKVILSRNV